MYSLYRHLKTQFTGTVCAWRCTSKTLQIPLFSSCRHLPVQRSAPSCPGFSWCTPGLSAEVHHGWSQGHGEGSPPLPRGQSPHQRRHLHAQNEKRNHDSSKQRNNNNNTNTDWGKDIKIYQSSSINSNLHQNTYDLGHRFLRPFTLDFHHSLLDGDVMSWCQSLSLTS